MSEYNLVISCFTHLIIVIDDQRNIFLNIFILTDISHFSLIIRIRIRTSLFDNAAAVIKTFKLKLFNTRTKC